MNNFNLFRFSSRLLSTSTFAYRPLYCFSDYFKERDRQEMFHYDDKKVASKKLQALQDLWQKPLERKRRRQARIAEIKASLPEPQPEAEKLIIHNPALGIRTPNPDDIFAVVKVDSRQYKVTNSCMIVLDGKPHHEINQKIVFEQVLLAGTPTFTLLGRPTVKSITVEGVIESTSLSEKIIVFKKKRRKQYKKSFGSRLPLTTCRITSIVCNLAEDILQKAVPLQ